MRNLKNQLKHFGETQDKIARLQQEQFQLATVILRTCQNPEQVKELTQEEMDFLIRIREHYQSTF